MIASYTARVMSKLTTVRYIEKIFSIDISFKNRLPSIFKVPFFNWEKTDIAKVYAFWNKAGLIHNAKKIG